MSEVNTNNEYHVDTDEVLEELQKEGFEVEGKTEAEEPEQPQEEPEGEPEVVEEPEEKETDEQETVEPVDRVPKEPTLIPAWKAKIAEERLSKENATLKAQLEAYQNNPTVENRKSIEEGVNDIRQLANEYGLQIDENQEQFFKALVKNVQKTVPDDVLNDVKAFQQQQQINYLETQYEKEFSEITPIIKEKYGELSDEQLTTLRNKLHDIAFTEQYAKVPLSKIFKAEADDLGYKPVKQAPVFSKSGKTRNTDIDLHNVDEDTFANLPDDQIDAFIQQKAGNRKWSR